MKTERLILRPFTREDAGFVLRLLNDPDWLRFIGDRGVRDTAGAEAYIERNRAARERNGFGLDLVALTDGVPIGMCGLIRREGLDDVDLGFAFLPEHRGKGYALEAARSTLAQAPGHGLSRVIAITSQDNASSIALLEKLGFRFERLVRLPKEDEQLKLFALSLNH
jgi:RimJ/RimL family protein N-acetyltransferase